MENSIAYLNNCPPHNVEVKGTSPLCVCSDDISIESDETPEYTGSFEGPEKNLEVVFHPNIGAVKGLRTMTRQQLDRLCSEAHCTILSGISNNCVDAYVLSESSMFVYKDKFIMKTCGTTTLLRCLKSLLAFADQLAMQLMWVGYSRKNLMNPAAQQWPHSSFNDEIQYLNTHAKLQDRLQGSGHILGPVTGDHWFVYVADHSRPPSLMLRSSSTPALLALPRTHHKSSTCMGGFVSELAPNAALTPSTERTVNVMMFDMDMAVAELFFKTSGLTAQEMTSKSGIAGLCPGANIDAASFTPCGYSMNAILHDEYSTIHVTPEQHCSYVSFETNACLFNYVSLVRSVLAVFRPQRFVLTMFGDEDAIATLHELPTDPKKIIVPGFGCYTRSSTSSTKVETDLCCMMGCFSLDLQQVVQSGGADASGWDMLQRERGYTVA